MAGDIGDAWPALGEKHLPEPVGEIAPGVEGAVDNGEVERGGEPFEKRPRTPAVGEIFTPIGFENEQVCVSRARAHDGETRMSNVVALPFSK